MLHSDQQIYHEARKAKHKRRSRKKIPNFFEDVHPSIKKCMENLNDIYSNLISTYLQDQPSSFDIFNQDIMAKTFAEAHKGTINTFVVKPEEWDTKQKKYLNNLDELYQRTLERFQGQEVDPIIMPKGNDRRFKSAE